jgi:hypothetical protein
MSLTKPLFESCDETSLKLKSNYIVQPHEEIYVQYKLPHMDWDDSKLIPVHKENSVALADIVDLEPGTAYNVRFLLKNLKDGSQQIGPETVFDTKPIDCTPKGRNCILS